MGSARKTQVRPHLFVPDPGQGFDHRGRQVCATCGLIGVPGDTHHTVPDTADDAQRRAAGERDQGEPDA